MTATIIAIIASVISCVRYLNMIQQSNFYFYPKSWRINLTTNNINGQGEIINNNSSISYIISIITMLLIFAILKPVYLLSLFTYQNI